MQTSAPHPNHANRRNFIIGFVFSIVGCSLASALFLYYPRLLSPHAAAAKTGSGRLDLDAARARLLRAGGEGIAFPLPNPRIVVCKEYRQLDLYAGERFVKRYAVALDLGRAPEGTFAIGARELPRGSERWMIGLSKPSPSSPFTLAIDDSGTSISSSGNISMRPGDLAEIFVATSPGTSVIIEK